jgi:hypothetical protein
MPRHVLKLLVLLTAVAVTPATAGHRSGANRSHDPACPYERARLAAALAQTQAQQAPTGPTRITLTAAVPADRSLSNVGPGRMFTP